MTGFLKGKAVGRVDEVLIEGKKYTEKELKEIVRASKHEKKQFFVKKFDGVVNT